MATVVVTYNRKSLLRQCLKALQGQTHPIEEIIVVDNASTDGTPEMVQAEFPDVTLRMLDENRGGAGGFHEGMKTAASRDVDWIWVMDDDAEPKSSALQCLFDSELHEDSDSVGLASLKVGRTGRVQRAHAGTYDPIRMKRSAVRFSEGVRRIQFSSFVGLMVRQTAINSAGLPAKEFFIRHDDVEFSLRLISIGNLYLVPASRIIHHNSPRRKTQSILFGIKRVHQRPLKQYWKRYYGIRNPLLILHRHADTKPQRLMGVCVALAITIKEMLVVLLIGDERVEQLSILFAAFSHGIQGLCGHYAHPIDFPQTLHPEALHPFQRILAQDKASKDSGMVEK